MHAVSLRVSLVAGALIALVGCYTNNAGLLDLDAGVGGIDPIGPGPDGGTGDSEGDGGTGGTAGVGGVGGGAGGAGGSGGKGATGGAGGDPLTGEWQPPEIIEEHAGTGLNPHVAIGANGEAVAVWVQFNLGAYNVRANHYASGDGWEGDTWIGSTDGNTMDLDETSQPYVVVDPDGVATAAWGDFADPVLRGVVSRRYESASGWGGIWPVYEGTSTAGDPRLSVDDTGNVMAVFATGTGAWANYFQTTGGWGDAEIIDNEPGQPTNLGVALYPEGDGWTTWSQTPNGLAIDIFGNRFTSGAGWGDAARVEDNTTGNAFEPDLAVSATGDAVFVWQQTAGLRYNIWASTWDAAAGELTAAERVDISLSASSPAVAMDAQGRATAVWIQSGPTDLQVAAARYSAEIGWGEPVVLSEGDIRGEPRVAMDAVGNAVVAYAQKAEFESLVDAWAQMYSGGEWLDPVRLGVDEFTGPAIQPSVAMAPSGNAVVVWREGPDIWASVFE